MGMPPEVLAALWRVHQVAKGPLPDDQGQLEREAIQLGQFIEACGPDYPDRPLLITAYDARVERLRLLTPIN